MDTWTHGHLDTWPKRSRMVVGTLCVTTCFISITVSLKEPESTNRHSLPSRLSTCLESCRGHRGHPTLGLVVSLRHPDLAPPGSPLLPEVTCQATRPLLEEARPQLRGWAHCQKQCGQACPRMTTRDRPFCGLLGGLQDPGTMVLKYGPQP